MNLQDGIRHIPNPESEPTVMKITPDAIGSILGEITKPCYVVFTYESTNHNFLAGIAKINFDYKAELNAEQAADGQELTEPGKRQWGEKMPYGPLVFHKGHLYLACWITQNFNHVDADGVPQGEVLGYRDLKIKNIQTLAIADKIFNICEP